MIFTHQHPTEGKVGIGRIPSHIDPILKNISAHFFIPRPQATAYHVYYQSLDAPLNTLFDQVQYDPFFHNLGTPVEPMNEIYYSNPKPRFEKEHLYGAAANLIPHRDCILFYFPYIEFYRTIIGVWGSNNDTSTRFTNMNLEHKMNSGDYMIFDFDRTVHQVVKTGDHYSPRILLKLHYIACNVEFYGSRQYVAFVSYFYRFYYFVARYTEEMGTDPTTFIGFFYGIAWEVPFYPHFKETLISSYVVLFLIHRGHMNPIRHSIRILYYMFFAYLAIAFYHWIKYRPNICADSF